MSELHDLNVAILLTDGFEETEFCQVRLALDEAGACVEVVSPKVDVQGFERLRPADRILATRALGNVMASEYGALVLVGGALCADQLRADGQALQLVRDFQAQGKPIAALTHGVCVLASAGLVPGRRLAAPPSVLDDLRNAGGICPDRAVVVDRNWVTLREPPALRPFIHEMLALFGRATPSVIQIGESA